MHLPSSDAYKKDKPIVEPKYLKDLIVDPSFKKTYRGEDFLLGESGEANERVFLFSTPKNMKILSKNKNWMGDGTFAVLPLIFLQLYTILICKNNFALPLAYGLLPNKTTKTYKAFFLLIKGFLTSMPLSFNVDFELATFNAVKFIFGHDVQIYGCYFHLSQSFFRNVQLKGLIVFFNTEKEFKKCFLLSQALAFLPIDDVTKGFELLRDYCNKNCSNYGLMLEYIETYYVGKKESKARFEIKTWNVNQRVLSGLPRTSNKLERFNREFNSDSGDYHQATHDIIENLRLEQSLTEQTLLKIQMGQENPRNKLQNDLDNALKLVMLDYNKSEILQFLLNIALTIEKHNAIINKSKGKKPKNIAIASDDSSD